MWKWDILCLFCASTEHGVLFPVAVETDRGWSFLALPCLAPKAEKDKAPLHIGVRGFFEGGGAGIGGCLVREKFIAGVSQSSMAWHDPWFSLPFVFLTCHISKERGSGCDSLSFLFCTHGYVSMNRCCYHCSLTV